MIDRILEYPIVNCAMENVVSDSERAGQVPILRMDDSISMGNRIERIEDTILEQLARLLVLAEGSIDANIQNYVRQVRTTVAYAQSVCLHRVDHDDPDSDLRHDLTNHDPALALYAALEKAVRGTSRIAKLSSCQRLLTRILEMRGIQRSRN